jgi:predicted  nucleic acid-binding Zn-ribbon protein
MGRPRAYKTGPLYVFFLSSICNRQSKIGNEEHVTDPNEQFERLEEKLLKAIALFKRTQAEKRALEQEVEKLKGETKERAQALSAMERELIALRREREDVRSRVEKLVERFDALAISDTENSG